MNEGFTIVRRKDHAPRVHLLRPWPECNTTEAKSGRDTVRFTGSREALQSKILELGHHHGVPCRRCFPKGAAAEVDAYDPIDVYNDPAIEATLDKYSGEERTVRPEESLATVAALQEGDTA